ncbi:MFS transporter [Streptomyces poonensis]|uniref:MFS transporter n=1 Tax=Streptomyces poonensis TaxID=68255 RepID=A0A918QF23_9ACTN|nr:MFS transporter [Streptomyces poonensis]GGZ43659.1 MFS transporter [Streptomyces poonensis]GLJ91685.1 MFS transporter [Streptomyces poonensis]
MSQSTATRAPAPAGARQTDHRWWILAFVGIAQLMVVLDATIVNIALPTAQADLDFSDGARQWVITAYSLAFGSLLLLGGRIADLFGRKITFLVGLVGFAVASAIGGAAPSLELLVAARALQGLFGALLAPAALSLLTTTFTAPKDRAKAFGVFGAIAGAGGAIGLLLGGLLTEYLTWRWTLYVNVAFAVVAFIGAFALLKHDGRNRDAALDVPGTVLVSAGLFGVVYGFANAESHSWTSVQTWGFLAAGAALLAVFTWWQTRAKHPLLPLRVLADRNRGASFVSVLLIGAAMFGVFLFLTYYMQIIMGFTPVRTGLAFLPMVGAMMTGTILATNVLVPRVGPKPVVPAGMAIGALGLLWMTTLGVDSSYATHVLPQLIVTGLGMGLIMATAMNLAVSGVAHHDAGVASAGVNTMQQVGGSIGTALLTTIASSASADYLASHPDGTQAVIAQASVESYSATYAWTAAIFAVGIVATVLLYKRGVPRHDESAAPAVHM